MSGRRYARILSLMVLATIVAAPFGTLAQNSNTGAATTSTRVISKKRARTRVVVERRSFLDAGTDVAPGERKFLDYALPPTHTPMDVVQNTGGRVGWHNSPLPGPFFPW